MNGKIKLPMRDAALKTSKNDDRTCFYFLFSSLLFSFSFPLVFFLVIAVFLCVFIYCIYSAIIRGIFTQIKAYRKFSEPKRKSRLIAKSFLQKMFFSALKLH